MIHKRQVDARDELGRWWVIRVFLPASDLQAVNTIFMYRLQSPHGSGHDSDGYGINSAYMTGTDDGAVPVAHHDIVAIFETVRARAVSDSFFALFKLLEQAKVSRDWE